MAKFIPGPLVSEIRNALGAQVFSRNQWGAYTRARVDPHENPTEDRVVAKDAMTAAALAWGTTLTDAQRVAWNAFADAMQVRARSPITTDVNGYALFHKLWLLALWWSGNTLPDPPADLNTPALSSASLSSDGALAQLFLTFSPTPVPAGEIIMVYATPPLNAGVSRPYRWFKPIAVFTAGTTSPQNIWTSYENAHGTPLSDKKIFSRCSAAFTYNNFPSVPLQGVTLVIGTPDAMVTAKILVTSAQLLDLVANPKLLIAAPGASKMIVPIAAYPRGMGGTTPYTIPAGVGLAVGWQSPLFDLWPVIQWNPILTNAAAQSGDYRFPADLLSNDDPAQYENQALYLGIQGAADLTLGDSNLQLTIFYAIADAT